MNRAILEWLWRAALIGALGWIGWEVHQIHEEMLQPTGDQTTAEAGPDELQSSIDELRNDVASLGDKVDALLVAMAHIKQ
jgi:hypothetical protein